MRDALGDDYLTALWKAHPKMPKAADFVMYWWDRAADILQAKGTRLKRFGFVTTNSITQAFNRRVLEARLDSRAPLSIMMAIPDHPWTKATKDAAAVRIAMSVAEAGTSDGLLRSVVREEGLDTDDPRIEFREQEGKIHADLTVGADATQAAALIANAELANTGMLLAGQGFKLTAAQAEHFVGRDGPEAAQVIRPYVGGGELVGIRRGDFVIDLDAWDEKQVRTKLPAIYAHLLATVKPQRDKSNDPARRSDWFRFGRRNTKLRAGVAELGRYIATTETAKHRIFQFIDATVVPDHMAITITSDDAFLLGVLSSRTHLEWALHAGGTLEDRPRYNKARCFDPFPFADPTEDQRRAIEELADELDQTRKAVQTRFPDLTMTGLYNVRAKLAAAEPLTAADRDVLDRGRVAILAELHNRLDAAVADAYGWPADLAADGIVARLVALNAERAAEERAGRVRWLRPDYQLARAGVTVLGDAAEAAPGLALPAAAAALPALPRDYYGRAAAVTAALAAHPGPATAEALAAGFKGGRATLRAIETVLDAAARVGAVAKTPHGWRLTRAA
ncbi:MAG: hypothetical protein INF91_07915 [Alphaproteobacteria bacterium]|nr:hypothetical protein [Alphaproteobacteria bacterium]